MNNWDAIEFAQQIRQKKVSTEEAVRFCIEQIEKLNPKINAVVSKQYDEALVVAKTKSLTDKVFGGVPILLKDLGQQQKGQPSTSGSRLFASYKAAQTDNFVKKLEDLGFIVLGRTNTPEFGFKNVSDSSLHGTVRLPLDLNRHAGGSSGGAAAALSSGMVPLVAASDGGGSIRIPASFNGLLGLKPTRGRIPVGPTSFRGWQGASSNFALTKSVRDTKTLLLYLQTCQMESPFPLPILKKAELENQLTQSLKIAYSYRSPIGNSISKAAKKAMDKTLRFLEKQGHELIEVDQTGVDGIEAMKSYYIMNSVETAAMFDDIEEAIGRQVTVEDMEVMTWAIYQSGQSILAKDFSKTLSQWDQYSRIMSEFHQTYDLYLTPTTTDVAPPLDAFNLSSDLKEKLFHLSEYTMLEQQDLIWTMFEKSLAWTPFTQQANLTGQPSMSLPVYKTKDGLPIGVQITAAKGREDILLQLAQLFENEQQLEYGFVQ